MSTSKNSTVHVLYFNGLGSGKTRNREQWAMHHLAKHGIKVTHIPINWRSDESFEKLFNRTTRLVQEGLHEHGKLILVGASAGGSLALNILGRLQDKNLSIITLCSRLKESPLTWWDKRTLKHLAHIGVPGRESQSFFDSVMYCTNRTIPKLRKQDKKRIIIAEQWADEIVPRITMGIDGVRTRTLPIIGHGPGIMLGMIRLRHIVQHLYE